MTDYLEGVFSRLDDEWRQILGKVMSDCIAVAPDFKVSEYELQLAAHTLARSVDDCEALDAAEGGSYFASRFRLSMATQGLVGELLLYSTRRPDGRQLKSMTTKQGAVVTYLRERLRDGVPLQFSLREMSKAIEEFAAAGDTDFFLQLSRALDEMRKRPYAFQRDIRQWIARGWIPLALWMERHNPQAAHDQLQRAGACLEVTRNINLEYPIFYRAWSKFKSSMMK